MSRKGNKKDSMNYRSNSVEENEHAVSGQQQEQSLLEYGTCENWNSVDAENEVVGSEREEKLGGRQSSPSQGQKEPPVGILRSLSNGLSYKRNNLTESEVDIISSIGKMDESENVNEERKSIELDSGNSARSSKEERSVEKPATKDISKERRRRSSGRSFERDEEIVSTYEVHNSYRHSGSRRFSRDDYRRVSRRSESRHSRDYHRRISGRRGRRYSRDHSRRIQRRSRSAYSRDHHRRAHRMSERRYSRDRPSRHLRREHRRSRTRENTTNHRIRDDESYDMNFRREREMRRELENAHIPILEPTCGAHREPRRPVNQRDEMRNDEDENQKFRKIFVGNISSYSDMDKIFEEFSMYGPITDYVYMRKFAFIEYADAASARRAIQEGDGKLHLNRVLFVEPYRCKSPYFRRKHGRAAFRNRSASSRRHRRSMSRPTSLERKVASRIVVEMLDRSVNLQDLKHFGQVVGPLSQVIILENSKKQRFGVIEYKYKKHVEKALYVLRHKSLKGREVSLKSYNESYEFGYREIEKIHCRIEYKLSEEKNENKCGRCKEKERSGDKEKLAEKYYKQEGKSTNEKSHRAGGRMSRSKDRYPKEKTEKRENDVGSILKEKLDQAIKRRNRTKGTVRDESEEMSRKSQGRKSRSLKRRRDNSNDRSSREFPNRESYASREERNSMISPNDDCSSHIDKKMKRGEGKEDYGKGQTNSSKEKYSVDRERTRDLEKTSARYKKRMHSNENSVESRKNVETTKKRKHGKTEEKKEQIKESSDEREKQTYGRESVMKKMECERNAKKLESLSTTGLMNFMNQADQKKVEEKLRREIEEELRLQIKEELKVENENKLRIEIEKELRAEIQEELRKEHEEIIRKQINKILKIHNEEELQMGKFYPLRNGESHKQEKGSVQKSERKEEPTQSYRSNRKN